MEEKKITRDELRLLAELAGFHPDEAWIDQLIPQLETMLRGVNRLNEMQLGEVEPAFIEPARKEL